MPLALIPPAVRFIRCGTLRLRELSGRSFAAAVTPSFAPRCQLPVEPESPSRLHRCFHWRKALSPTPVFDLASIVILLLIREAVLDGEEHIAP